MADDKTIKDSINIDDYRKLIRSYLDLVIIIFDKYIYGCI